MTRDKRTTIAITGSLDDPKALDLVLEGADAVSIVFGPRPPHADAFCAAATKAILAAMNRVGIGRLVCQTGALIGEYPQNRSLPFRWMAKIYQRSQPDGAADRAEQERLIKESDLEWTLIKPPRLTNGLRSKRFRAGAGLKVGLLSSVSRADVAALTLREILEAKHMREAVFLAG